MSAKTPSVEEKRLLRRVALGKEMYLEADFLLKTPDARKHIRTLRRQRRQMVIDSKGEYIPEWDIVWVFLLGTKLLSENPRRHPERRRA